MAKKSKQYAKEIIDKYIETDFDTAVTFGYTTALCGLYDEYQEICKMRKLVRDNGISYGGMLSVLKELQVKWLSIVNNVNKEVNLLPETGWLEFVKEAMPDMYDNFILELTKNRN